jgi:hypothetical protein
MYRLALNAALCAIAHLVFATCASAQVVETCAGCEEDSGPIRGNPEETITLTGPAPGQVSTATFVLLIVDVGFSEDCGEPDVPCIDADCNSMWSVIMIAANLTGTEWSNVNVSIFDGDGNSLGFDSGSGQNPPFIAVDDLAAIGSVSLSQVASFDCGARDSFEYAVDTQFAQPNANFVNLFGTPRIRIAQTRGCKDCLAATGTPGN